MADVAAGNADESQTAALLFMPVRSWQEHTPNAVLREQAKQTAGCPSMNDTS